MRNTLILAMVLFCATIQGCGVAYHQNATNLAQTAKAEDYGPMPTDYENTIRSFMEVVLIDPESARYSNWGTPRQAIIQSDVASPTPILGWQVDVYVNAKNRMGGYTGAKQYGFFFTNNRVYAHGEMRNGRYWWDYAR